MKSELVDIIANLKVPGCTVEPAGEAHFGKYGTYTRSDFIAKDEEGNIIRICVLDINEQEGEYYGQSKRETNGDEERNRTGQNQVRRVRRPVEGASQKAPRRVRMQGFGFSREEIGQDRQGTGIERKRIRKRHS